MAEFPNKQRLYRYELVHTSGFGVQPLYNAPSGWRDEGYNFKRSSDYFGMFREYSEQVVTFTKEGRRFLLKILENGGIESICQYVVKKFNFDTHTYDTYFSGNIDFSTKKVTRKTFECKIIDSSFEATLRNREDNKIQLFDLTTIDQQQMIGYTNEGEFILLPERTDFLFSTLKSDRDISYDFSGFQGIVPLLKIVSQEDDNVTENQDTPNIQTSAFFTNRTGEEILIEVEGEADFIATIINANFIPEMRVYQVSNNDLVTKIPLNLQEEIIEEVSSFQIKKRFFGNFTFNYQMPDETYAAMYLDLEGTRVIVDAPLVLDFTIKTETATIPDSSVKAMLYHEVGSRIVYSYTNQYDSFVSDLLGRTDSEPRTYSSDGDLSLGAVMNGKLIREFTEDESVLSASLKEYFETINRLRCACFTVEEIGGKKVARIEEMKYAFDDRIILTIDNAKDISFEVNQDWIFNKITAGYDKAAYEERNGLLEFNNKSEYSTFIKTVKNDLDLVIPWRADSQGFTEGRNLPKKDFPTTDSDIDEDNFILDLVRNESATEVVNGDFEQPLSTGWNSIGSISRYAILNSTRAFLNDSVAELIQIIPITETSQRTFRFSYQMEGSPPSYFPPLITDFVPMYFQLSINNGVDTYYIDSSGQWSLTEQRVNFVALVPTLQENIQSFYNYELALDVMPITGNLSIRFYGSDKDPFGNERDARVVLDDVFLAEQARYTARTNEGFDYIQNTLNNNKVFNVRYSPGRIIRNWGKIIRSGLEKYLSSSLVYNTSDKNSKMISKLTGEPEVKENENILVNDLDQSFLLPETIKFDAPVGLDEISTINSNFASDGKPKKYGIVKVRDELNHELYHYGWIVNVNSGAKTESQSWELIMVNTDKITPIIE